MRLPMTSNLRVFGPSTYWSPKYWAKLSTTYKLPSIKALHCNIPSGLKQPVKGEIMGRKCPFTVYKWGMSTVIVSFEFSYILLNVYWIRTIFWLLLFVWCIEVIEYACSSFTESQRVNSILESLGNGKIWEPSKIFSGDSPQSLQVKRLFTCHLTLILKLSQELGNISEKHSSCFECNRMKTCTKEGRKESDDPLTTFKVKAAWTKILPTWKMDRN